ncbi:hypothetical protein ACSBR2_006951 [Camellia fascicularis]
MQGCMVGNGVVDSKFDGNALIPFAHGMGLISDGIFEEAEDACKGNYYNPNSLTCQLMISKVESVIKDLNLYDILEPCYHSPTSKEDENANTSLPLSFKQLGVTERPLAVRKRIFGRAWPLRAPVRDGIVPMWPQLMENSVVPCINDEVATIWLNNDAVRKPIHASLGSGRWRLCTDQMAYTHDAGSMINYHKNLSTQGYRVLIYSGDHDMCVPFTGSQAWTRSLGYNIVDEWRPWLSSSGVAGFTQGYANNLTFLTIKMPSCLQCGTSLHILPHVEGAHLAAPANLIMWYREQGIQYLNISHKNHWTSIAVAWFNKLPGFKSIGLFSPNLIQAGLARSGYGLEPDRDVFRVPGEAVF